MEDLTNKTVLITGASSGIGYATAKLFAQYRVKLILTGRRINKIKELSKYLKQQYNINIITYKLDVCDQNQVTNFINNLSEDFQKIDILINNAGLALGSEPIQNGSIENWETMIDTNIKGLLYLTRAILPKMINNGGGHIVNLGSSAGRLVYPGGNVYCATKYAVKAISQAIRHDTLGKNIRVTEIAPAAVQTEFSEVRWKDKQKADEFYAKFKPLQAEDIADNILYAVTRPKHVNIAEMVISSVDQVGTAFNLTAQRD
ncbi:MAG: SDR family NAD(P)-dependent oxidoreductase [Gammaproteobacteria bacterium]|nr:SDR family NAD(P)-dependent oxidoreductase [Gammaproteobacteria bacterium]